MKPVRQLAGEHLVGDADGLPEGVVVSEEQAGGHRAHRARASGLAPVRLRQQSLAQTVAGLGCGESMIRDPRGVPLLGNLTRPAGPEETRWLDGLYLAEPVLNDDDPYRFFRW